MTSRREALKFGLFAGLALGTEGVRRGFDPARAEIVVNSETDPNVEAIKAALEGRALMANNSVIEIIRMQYQYGTYVSTANWNPQWLYAPERAVVSNHQFEVVKMEDVFYPSSLTGLPDYYSIAGYMPTMTGDISRWRVEVGRYYPDGGQFEWKVAPVWGDGFSQYPGLEARYGAGARRTFYPNKLFNILKALRDFRVNALNGFGPGEEFSYLTAIQLAQHLREEGYYLPGYDASGEIVRAGGVCASVTAVGKATYRAKRAGWMEFVKIQPHSHGQEYFVNLEDRDTVDATAAISDEGIWVDLVTRNISDRRLWYVPRAQILLPNLPEGTKLPNSLLKPKQNNRSNYEKSSAIMFSITLTDRQPTLADSQSIEDAFWQLCEHQAKYGTGSQGGFNLA